ncbi:MAG: DUF6067 family protein [Candidatus Marinimicrobia bacterium]|nr:DUF6067 family protein [Candidatus Neomarinimicrobiota bacterium]
MTLRYPWTTAPRPTGPAPVIDGRKDKAEWAGAARPAPLISGLTGLRTEEEAVYWIAYTDEALYLAFRFERPPYAREPSERDVLEVMLSPTFGAPTDFNFRVTGQGETHSATRSGGATADRSWAPPWQAAARPVASGWEGELKIPFASLDVAPPAPGDLWDLQVARNRRSPVSEVGYASYQTAWRARGQFAGLRFGGAATPTVSLLAAGPLNPREVGALLEILGGAAASEVALDLTLYRPDPAAAAQTVIASEVVGDDVWIPEVRAANFFEQLAAGGPKQVLAAQEALGSVRETVLVEAHTLRRFPLAIEAGPGNYLLVYRVTDKASGRILLGGAVPFEQRAPLEFEVEGYPLVAQAAGVTVNYIRLGEAVEGGRVEAELRQPDTGEVLVSRAAAVDLQSYRSVLMLPFPEGGAFSRTYEVRARLLDAAGRLIGAHESPLRLPERPEWLGNNIGITEDPLPGWGPIRLEGEDRALVDLREYQFAASGLPAAITSRDKELLSAPVTLTLDGRAPDWQRQRTYSSDGKAVWEARAATAGLAWTLKTTLEYDGMLRYDLTLDPGAAPVDVRELVLRIPYRRDRARFGAEAVFDEFKPYHEVGDFDTGLFWFCEWAKGWQIGEQPPMALQPDGDVVDWQVRFIGVEGKTLAEPLTLTWGLQALPVRKLDRHIQYENRRVYRTPPTFTEGDVLLADLSETWLEYPAAGHLNADEGALIVRINASRANTRLVRIGDGEESVNISYEGSQRSGGVKLTLHRGAEAVAYRWSYEGVLARTDLFIHDGWIPVSLAWRRAGDAVRLDLMTQDHGGGIRHGTATVPAAFWAECLAHNRLILGGEGTVAVDSVLVLRAAQAPAALGALFAARPEAGEAFTLIDPIGDIRFSRGSYMTRPLKSADGRGGVAGARYGGSFVQSVAGEWGRAVLLPSREQNITPEDVLTSYGVGIAFPDHEQWKNIAGFYGTAFAPSPSYRSRIRPYHEKGLEYMFYGDMGLEAERNTDIGPFMNELARHPIARTYTGLAYDMADRPTQDYYIWGWQKTMDYYGVNSIHMDNTIRGRWINKNPVTGHGWYDDDGNLQGRWAIFGAREAAKRFRWLHHVYITNGVVSLHAGARHIPPISGFADLHQGGEGGFYMHGDIARDMILPEDWGDGYQYRFGVPVEILTKRGRQDWGPNFLFLYTLLFDMDIRNFGAFYHPSYWHVNPRRPDVRTMGAYDPYFAQVGVSEQSTPQVLLWQLKDEFGTRTAEFRPFWDNAAEVTLAGGDKLRSSFYLHPGTAALFVLSNFDTEPVAAEMTLNLEALGLANRPLRAYDAFTDEPYAMQGARITVPVPGAAYRLVRVEAP